MKYMFIVAASAAMLGCNSQKAAVNGMSNGGGNNLNGAANSTGSASAPAAAAPAAGAPAAAYLSHFNERWARAGAPVTPAEVTEMLKTQTPQQTVNALWGSGEENNRWSTVASGIAKGDPAWLAIAPQIAKGTDAGTSDEFGMAAQDALTTNPTGALRMLTQTEMGVGACSENGFEVPRAQAVTYYQTAIAAVEGVNDPALQEIKSSCLAALRKGMAEYPADQPS